MRAYNHELFRRYIDGPRRQNGYSWYEAAFPSPLALQAYLRSKPPINRDIFGYELLSAEREDRFHGVPLSSALRFLTGGYTTGLRQLLKLKREFDRTLPPSSPHIAYKKSPNGSHFHIPNALAGSPNYMLTPVRQRARRNINVHFSASYSMSASDQQILHRGLLTLSLIDLLESQHFRVHLRIFEMSYTGREIMLMRVLLRHYGGALDKSVANFIMCSKEFLRRIVFAVQETMPVAEAGWKNGYGKLFPLHKTRQLLEIPSADILIGSPRDMGILGQDLQRDADAFFATAGLERYIPNIRK